MVVSFSSSYRLRPSQPDVTADNAAQSGAKRTGQAENWGRPSGGTDFPLARHGGGFSVTSEGRVSELAARRETADLDEPAGEGVAAVADAPPDVPEPRAH